MAHTKKTTDNKSKGFTLIEVVIVLAIGALIILVVIQAIGAARRSQRDSARKQEGARVAALLEQIASNSTAGRYPSNATNLDTALTSYDSTLATQYTFTQWTGTGTCPAQGPGTFTMLYRRVGSAGKDYDLKVCLEAGGFANFSLQ